MRRYKAALYQCGGYVELNDEDRGPFCFGIARVHNGGNELGSRKTKKSSRQSEFDTVIEKAVAGLMQAGEIFVVSEDGKPTLWLTTSYEVRGRSRGPMPRYSRGERRRRWQRVVKALKKTAA